MKSKRLSNVKLEMIDCTKCRKPMPLLRLKKFGYKHCINCSTVSRGGGIPITNHKTGNSIQIVPIEVADRINKLAKRQGYGVCNGMKSSA